MLTRILNWAAKPITWGAYLKLCGIVYLVTIVAGFIWVFWDRIVSLSNRFLSKIESLRG